MKPKTIFITYNNIEYLVNVRKLKTDSNYDTGISIHAKNEKTPLWGTVIKSTDNISETALSVIKTWTNKGKPDCFLYDTFKAGNI
jgi:lipopolysaccharide export LptBFGC system permease protein LptF